MPSYIPLLGMYVELGSGATGQQGRVSTNLNKVAFDTTGAIFSLKSNGDNASRVAFAQTMIDQTNTVAAKAGAVCIQPATARLMNFAGFWAASVNSSGQTDGTDLHWVQNRGTASAVPITSGTSHVGSTSLGMFMPLAAADKMDSVAFDVTLSNFSDFAGGRYTYLIGASVASTVTSANMWLSLPLT